MPRDEILRQGSITNFAFLHLGKEIAIPFLNTDDPALGGSPLAIATASAAGEAQVRGMVRKIADGAQGDTTQ